MGSFQYGMLVEGVTSTATAAGTTSLTSTSSQIQNFTGSTTQTVKLPATTGMTVGQFFEIYNSSSGALTIQYQDASSFTPNPTIAAGSSLIVKLVSTGSSNGTWVVQSSSSSLTGDVTGTTSATLVSKIQGTSLTGVTGTGNAVLSDSPTLSGTIGGTLTFSGAQTLSAAGTALTVNNNALVSGTLNSGNFTTNSTGTSILTLKSTLSGAPTQYIEYLDTSSTQYNWVLGNNYLVNGMFQIIPSTVAGGTTFSTAAISVAGSTGDVTLGGSGTGLTVTNNVAVSGLMGIGTAPGSNIALQVSSAGVTSTTATFLNSTSSRIFIQTSAASGFDQTIRMMNTTNNNFSWSVGANLITSNKFEIVPSTSSTAGSNTTFTTPAVVIDGSTGDVTLNGSGTGLTVNNNAAVTGVATLGSGSNISGTAAAGYVPAQIKNLSSTGFTNLEMQIGAAGANGIAGIYYAPGTFFKLGMTSNDTTTPLLLVTKNTTAVTIDTSQNATFAGNIRVNDSTNPNSASGGYLWGQAGVGPTVSGFNVAINTGSTGSQAQALFISSTQAATFAGNLITSAGAISTQGYDTSSPATGGTVTASANKPGVLITPSATIATCTIKLPSSPIDGQQYWVACSQIISAVTWQDSGGTAGNVIGGPTTIGGTGRGARFVYNTSGTKWYNIG